MLPQGPGSGRAQRGTTCAHCRRMKLRCDASAKFPNPCSRCERVGRSCSSDARGTRSQLFPDGGGEDRRHDSPQSRIVELEKQLKDLRGRLRTARGQVDEREAEDTPSDNAPTTLGSDDVGDADSDVSQSAAQLASTQGLVMPPMSLGDINVASHDFFNSIDLFYVHFHPQLPFLPGKRALLQDSLNCALLAWALFTVAARVSPDPNLNSIRVRLTWPVRRLASQSILAPRSLPAIQALLILCLWPMPYAALIDDPSWVFSGMAIQKALQLGMYRPLESLIDYAKGDHRVARSMQDTWLACLVVGQMQSTRHGIPSTIPLEHMDPQLQLSQGATVPSQMLRAAVELARKDMVISSLLSHRDGAGMPPDRPPALRALGIELEHLDAKIQQCQSPLLQRMLCSTKIRLYSFALRAEHDAPATGIGGKEDLIIYISKAYAVARHIIINSLEDQVGKWSFIDLQSFIMALFIVLHISRRHHSVCNVQQVLEMFQRASALLKSCSVIDGDHFYRVCEIINYLLAQPPAGSESSDQPVESEAMATTIQPAAGIGVAYDIIKEAKKRYRRSVWFPEEFPDLSSSAAVELETGSSSAGVGAGDWIQEDPLMQSMFAPDLNIASWLGWDENSGFH